MFILDFIAKNIARPISTLAMAATAVKEGHFDDVYNPQRQKIKGDEVSCLYDSFYDMVKGLKEKERVRGILNKVVSADVAEEILKKDLNLGGEDKQISILFADIRGFTELTEHMEPKDVIEILNQVMTLISKPIEAHHGVIDKYVGDEVMALFGAPLDLVDHEYQAVVAALKMRESLDQFNNERKKANKKEVLMGIGVHDGNVLAGNMGAETRLNYTVIGSNVNMAARMCSAAKGGEILVSESIIKNPKVAREIEVRALEPILFKGFSNKVNIYAVVGFKKQN
jgi:adenylate cyclase